MVTIMLFIWHRFCWNTRWHGKRSYAKWCQTTTRTKKKVCVLNQLFGIHSFGWIFIDLNWILMWNSNSYKHCIDGLLRVHREEGFRRLFSGASTATGRGFFMTIGQSAFYDQVKIMLLTTGYFKDDPRLHFVASVAAGAIATALTQPLDVIKTRSMNAKPGEFNGLFGIIAHTAKLGPMGFFKGFVPAFVRLGPHTILLFLFLEQLRLNFGVAPSIPNVANQKL